MPVEKTETLTSPCRVRLTSSRCFDETRIYLWPEAWQTVQQV